MRQRKASADQAAEGDAGVARLGLVHGVLLYFAFLGAAATAMFFVPAPATGVAVWLPSGLYMGLLLVAPHRAWPAVMIAAFAAEMTGNAFWYGNEWLVAVIIHAGNAAEALVGAVLVRRGARGQFDLNTPREVVALLGLGAALAPAFSATLGATTDYVFSAAPFGPRWVRWYVSDATGVVVMVPLVLFFARRGRGMAPPLSLPRRLEAAALVLVLTGLAFATLGERGGWPFFVIAPLLWAAIRFEFVGAAFAPAYLAAAVSAFTRAGVSPFAGPDWNAVSLYLPFQFFLLVSSGSSLVVASLARQQRLSLEALRVANDDLERRVAARTADLAESEERLRLALDAAHGAAWHVDLVSGAVTWSDAHFRMLGYAVDPGGRATIEMWRQRVHPKDIDRVLAEWRRAESARDGFSCDYRIIRRDDNAVRHVRGVGIFQSGRDGAATRFAGAMFDITDEKRHEQRQRMLIHELSHRVKNTLASVQSIALQSLKGRDGDVADFLARLSALAAGHDLLARERWDGAPLDDVVRRTAAAQGGGRVHVAEGPRIWLPPRQTLALTLALHELATNALKYGALSIPSGRVDIAWTASSNRFRLEWRESGGPPVAPPDRRGFGTRLLERGLRHDLDGEITVEFRREGVYCVVDAPAPEAADMREPDLVAWY